MSNGRRSRRSSRGLIRAGRARSTPSAGWSKPACTVCVRAAAGAPWPHDFAPYDTVFDHWQRWQERGVWQEAVAVLGTRWREQELGRARRVPRHAILDRQSVKSAAEGEERGFQGGKKIKGRSRHVAIDSQGTRLAVHVRAAHKADGREAGAVMVQACERHPSIESFTANGSYQRQAERVARENNPGWHSMSPPSPRCPSRADTGSKRGLCARQVPLARRAHLRLAGPVPAALQGGRKNRRQRRGVALVRHDALAHSPPCRLTQQVLSVKCRSAFCRSERASWESPGQRPG